MRLRSSSLRLLAKVGQVSFVVNHVYQGQRLGSTTVYADGASRRGVQRILDLIAHRGQKSGNRLGLVRR